MFDLYPISIFSFLSMISKCNVYIWIIMYVYSSCAVTLTNINQGSLQHIFLLICFCRNHPSFSPLFSSLPFFYFHSKTCVWQLRDKQKCINKNLLGILVWRSTHSNMNSYTRKKKMSSRCKYVSQYIVMRFASD